MSNLLATPVAFLTDLAASLTTSFYDPRAWLTLFLGLVLGYGRGLWRWWVPALALVVAIAADTAIRAYAPFWGLTWQSVSVASSLVSAGILVLGYVAGYRLGAWSAPRRTRRP